MNLINCRAWCAVEFNCLQLCEKSSPPRLLDVASRNLFVSKLTENCLKPTLTSLNVFFRPIGNVHGESQ